jgi:hypothetical protein
MADSSPIYPPIIFKTILIPEKLSEVKVMPSFLRRKLKLRSETKRLIMKAHSFTAK